MQDFFKITIPKFQVEFKEAISYNHEDKKKKVELRDVLTKSSRGYCMYCYVRILIDRKNFGHLEHTIEQNSIGELAHCHHNISIACPKCNLSFKKSEQAKRKIIPTIRIQCNKNECKNTKCQAWYDIGSQYINNMQNKNLQKIIIQPYGVFQRLNNIDLFIDYDLLNFKYVPKNKNLYTQETIEYIKSHIKKFRLNNEEYRTKEIRKIIDFVLEYEKIPKKGNCNNLIGELFIEKLEELKDIEKVKKICKTLNRKALLKRL